MAEKTTGFLADSIRINQNFGQKKEIELIQKLREMATFFEGFTPSTSGWSMEVWHKNLPRQLRREADGISAKVMNEKSTESED